MLVDIDQLHRAPPGTIVYRNLEKKQVSLLMDQKWVMPFQPSLQHLYVMPVMGDMSNCKEDYKLVPSESYEYFDRAPTGKILALKHTSSLLVGNTILPHTEPTSTRVV